MNVITLIMYAWDKWQSMDGGWRTRNMTLLLLAVFGGPFGAITGKMDC